MKKDDKKEEKQVAEPEKDVKDKDVEQEVKQPEPTNDELDAQISIIKNQIITERDNMQDSDKTSFGFFLGLLFSLVGLLIGVSWFPMGSKRRDTFMQGWFTGFVIGIVLAVFVYIIYYIVLLRNNALPVR